MSETVNNPTNANNLLETLLLPLSDVHTYTYVLCITPLSQSTNQSTEERKSIAEGGGGSKLPGWVHSRGRRLIDDNNDGSFCPPPCMFPSKYTQKWCFVLLYDIAKFRVLKPFFTAGGGEGVV